MADLGQSGGEGRCCECGGRHEMDKPCPFAQLDRIAELETRLSVLEAALAGMIATRQIPVMFPSPPLSPPLVVDCGCPVNNVCNSTACPRAPKWTCS